MTSIQLISDLHLDHYIAEEAYRSLDNIPPCDILVIAGDTCELHNARVATNFFKPICDKFEKVLFITGNHDYFHNAFSDVDAICGEMCERLVNLFRLDNDYVTLDSGVRIFGGTMWYKLTRQNKPIWSSFIDSWNIHNSAHSIPLAHRKFMTEARKHVRKGDIVVTHHLPSYKSVAARWQGSEINEFFVSEDAGSIIKQKKPAYWLHGHTHDAFDYTISTTGIKNGKPIAINGTRVIANPFGYPRESGVKKYPPVAGFGRIEV